MASKRVKEIYQLADLRNWRRVARSENPPVRLGVLGDPVAHSLSPQMQNAALRHGGIDLQYARFQIAPNELSEALRSLRTLDFVGFNLTVPHKKTVVPLLDELSAAAQSIGAVNTVICRSGKLFGDNTDGHGISAAVSEAPFSGSRLSDFVVLLLGAGGAGHAIARQCVEEGVPKLILCNRSRAAAEKLREKLSALRAETVISVIDQNPDSLRGALREAELLINATSVGLRADDALLLPHDSIPQDIFVYDTIYEPPQSRLLQAAEAAGAVGVNGLSMLLHQGARSFELWFQRKAPIAEMRRALAAAQDK